MCAFIELWRRDLRTTCPPRVCEPGRSLRSFPSRGESSGRGGSLRNGALFVGPATPGSSLRSARRQRSDSAVAGLRTWGAAARAAQRAANFPCNIIRRLRFAASPAQQSPAKTVATRGAKYNKGVTHCLAPVLADCDRNHACGNGPLRHRCSARTSFGLVMRIVGKIRENSSANAKRRLLRHCVPHAITGRCAGRNRSESGLCPLDPTYRRLDGGASAASSGRSSGMGIEARAAIGRG